MRVALVFPNSLCLPNQMYLALPLLGGALKRAGHEHRLADLNLLAADLFLDRARAEHYLALARAHADGRDDPAFRAAVDRASSVVLAGQEHKEVLRDPARAFDQAKFKRAFWGVVDALAFLYQLDPVVSPHRDTFREDMLARLEEEPWTPVSDLYEEGLLDAVLADGPDLVGITLAFPEQAFEALRLAKRLRQHRPGLHLCLGGPLVTLYPETWLADGWVLELVDSVCVGDGETTIVELADALEAGGDLSAVRNLVHRDAAGRVARNDPTPVLEAMDALPVPDFDGMDMHLYLTPGPIYPLMLSRGCYWGRCTFCSIGWHENYRRSSEAKIRADVLDLAARGARYVQLQDSSIPPGSAAQLARICAEEGLELVWGGGMKFERAFLDDDYCRQLGEGGCVSLLMGFESAEQRLVDLMDKGLEVDQVLPMLRNLNAAGVSVEMLWFVGFPSETREEVLSTLRYLEEHRELFGLTAFVGDYLMHPDTVVADQPERFGVSLRELHNDHFDFATDAGMQPAETRELKRLLAPNNNRTLVCNGSHIPQLAHSRLDLRGLERPVHVSDDVLAFCAGQRAR